MSEYKDIAAPDDWSDEVSELSATLVAGAIVDDSGFVTNGVSGSAVIQNSAVDSIVSKFSLSTMVFMPNGTQFDRVLIEKWNDDHKSWSLRLSPYNNGFIKFRLSNDNSNIVELESTKSLSDEKWHSINIVFYPGKKITMYIDSIEDNSLKTGVPQTIYASGAPITFGGTENGSSCLNGVMNDIMLYNRIINAEEVYNYLNEQITKQKNLSGLLNDTFESGTLEDWNIVQHNNTKFIVGTSNPANGAYSMYVSSNNSGPSYEAGAITHVYKDMVMHGKLKFKWKCDQYLYGKEWGAGGLVSVSDVSYMPMAGTKVTTSLIRGTLSYKTAWTNGEIMTDDLSGQTKRVIFTFMDAEGYVSGTPLMLDDIQTEAYVAPTDPGITLEGCSPSEINGHYSEQGVYNGYTYWKHDSANIYIYVCGYDPPKWIINSYLEEYSEPWISYLYENLSPGSVPGSTPSNWYAGMISDSAMMGKLTII